MKLPQRKEQPSLVFASVRSTLAYRVVHRAGPVHAGLSPLVSVTLCRNKLVQRINAL